MEPLRSPVGGAEQKAPPGQRDFVFRPGSVGTYACAHKTGRKTELAGPSVGRVQAARGLTRHWSDAGCHAGCHTGRNRASPVGAGQPGRGAKWNEASQWSKPQTHGRREKPPWHMLAASEAQ